MNIVRRRFLQLGAGAMALSATSPLTGGDAYPSRPVHIVVGFPPGGGIDGIARLIGQRLSGRLGQPFVIENRAGSGGNIATELVARAAPDGYTLLAVWTGDTWNTTLYDNLNFDFTRDIAPVASISSSTAVIAVHPSFPAHSIPAFIEHAKANPNKIDVATAGVGTVGHIYGELVKMTMGIDVVLVHYRGDAAAITELLGGHIQVYIGGLPGIIEHIRAGKLRALAVTSAARWPALPDVPTLGESLPSFEASGWQGLGAPRDTPSEIIERLNREINAALADPGFKARLVDFASLPMPMRPAEFGKFIADETEKWAKVIRAAGIRAH
jgi:tripartite-type tricarboxylate transporter receptor subunit TctC